MSFGKYILLLAIFITFQLIEARSQISMNPPVVFIDPRSKAAMMELINTSDTPRELEIFFRFGYKAYDSKGNPYFEAKDTVAAENHSLTPYIKAYPKKLVIQPNTSQTVRFMLRNTAKLTDGAYWVRVVAKSQEHLLVSEKEKTDSIKAGMKLLTELAGFICYQTGKAETKLEVTGFKAEIDSTINIFTNFARGGNSPAWGTMNLTIYDSNDDPVESVTESMAIYFSCLKKNSFAKGKFKPGVYKAELTITSDRNDIPSDYRLDFDDIKQEAEFTVPAY